MELATGERTTSRCLPLPRPGGALVGRHRLHLKRHEPLPVGRAHRPLARRPAARSDDSGGELSELAHAWWATASCPAGCRIRASRTRRSSTGSGSPAPSGSSRERHHARRRGRRDRGHRRPGRAVPDLQPHEDGRRVCGAAPGARGAGRARRGAEPARPHERRARLRLAPGVPRGPADASGIRVGRRRVSRPRRRGRADLRARQGLGVLEHRLPAAATAARRARRAGGVPPAAGPRGREGGRAIG